MTAHQDQTLSIAEHKAPRTSSPWQMFICYLSIDVLLNLLIHREKEVERPQESGIVQAAFRGCEL